MSNSDQPHELVAFMEAVTHGLQSEYDRIRRRVGEDPGTAGDEGEENWAELLRQWLPPSYEVVTKGRIIDRHGEASPQIDVIVLRPFYPRYLRGKKLYLSGGVVAAFECKLTLKRHHIRSAFETGAKLRRLLDNRSTDPFHELNSTLIYGLLAHSHDWKKEQSDPIANIKAAITEDDLAYVTHPRECLDFICISDLATWSASKHPCSIYVDENNGSPQVRGLPTPLTSYGITHCSMFTEGSSAHRTTTPIGGLLGLILPVIAIHDETLKDFAWHFRQSGVWSGTSPVHTRPWSLDFFSEEARRAYIAKGLSHPRFFSAPIT